MEFKYYCADIDDYFEYKVDDEKVYAEAARILLPQKLDTKEKLDLVVATIREMASYIDDKEEFFTDIGVADVFETEAIEWYREGKEAVEELKIGYYRSVL